MGLAYDRTLTGLLNSNTLVDHMIIVLRKSGWKRRNGFSPVSSKQKLPASQLFSDRNGPAGE